MQFIEEAMGKTEDRNRYHWNTQGDLNVG